MTVFLLVWIGSNPGSATHQRGDLASASVSLSAVWEQPLGGINEVTHAEPLEGSLFVASACPRHWPHGSVISTFRKQIQEVS